MRRIPALVFASTIAIAGGLVAVSGGTAAAITPVTCGETLTVNTTLPNDLHCATGFGVSLVGNITLNLGGHGVYGANTSNGYSAVLVEGDDTATVTNGRIQEWSFGISENEDSIDPATVHVGKVTFVHLSTSIDTDQMTYKVTKSLFEYDNFGPTGLNSFGTVTHSRFYQVGTSIGLGSSGTVTASYDLFAGPSGASNTTVEGVQNSEGSFNIDHSTFDNVKVGVNSYFGPVNLTDVTITGAITAYEADYHSDATLTNDTFSHDFTGVELDTITVVNVKGGLFEYNNASLFVNPSNGGFPSTIKVNAAKFYKNTANGVVLAVAGSSLKNVRAIDNAGHGMVVIAGTIDGGGNIAYGNAASPQCVGILCAP
jgi:hypothetical protein